MVTKILAKPGIAMEVREFGKLAVPLAGAQLAQAAVGFVDTLMMGHLGAESLAAGGLASSAFQLVLNTTSGIVMSVSPLVAEAYGAGRKTQVEQIARQGLWLSLIIGIPMMFAISHLNSVMIHLGQAEQTVMLADGYLDYILWGFFPAIAFAMLRGYVSALSQARPIMIIVLDLQQPDVEGIPILARVASTQTANSLAVGRGWHLNRCHDRGRVRVVHSRHIPDGHIRH